MKTWRLIKNIETNGAMQMAIDEAILTSRIEGSTSNTLRFFTWAPSCITIGYFQSLEKEVDLEKTKELDVDVVRRYTGGGAVFHDKELTYSITISEKDVPYDIIESYKIICGAIVEGLKKLKVKSEFAPINDVVVKGKKISGNAQTRRENVVLQHGTILLDVDVKKMFSLLKVPDEKIKDKMIKSVEERLTSLNKEIGKEIDANELKNALIYGFEKVFKVKFIEEELSSEELFLAKKLYDEKYSKEEWIFLR